MVAGVVPIIFLALGQLDWSAPPLCPPGETVQTRAGRVDRPVRVLIVEGPTGWELEVQVEDSLRTLTAKTCEEATDAALLIIQLALGASEPVLPPVLEAPTPLNSEAKPRLSVHGALTGGASLAWLPTPVVRLGGTVFVRVGALGFGVDATTALEQRYPGQPAAPDAAVLVRAAFDGQLHGCWYFELDRLAVGPCVQASLSAFSVQGVNVTNPRQSTTWLWGAGPAVRATVHLVSFLEVVAGAQVRFGARPSVSFEGFVPVLEASPVSAELFLGIGGAW